MAGRTGRQSNRGARLSASFRIWASASAIRRWPAASTRRRAREAVLPRDPHDGDPKTLAAPLRAAVANVDPDLQIEEFLPLEDAGREERAFLIGIARR